MEIIKNTLGERKANIYKLRLSGLTLKAVADRSGCSTERVRQICAQCNRKVASFNLTHFNGLLDRTRNCLIADGIKTIKQLKGAYEAGRITAKTSRIDRVQLIGKAGVREIEHFIKDLK